MRLLLFFLITFGCWTTPAVASVLASLDRTTVAAGTSVQLTLSSSDEDGDPDLSPLRRDFDILSRSESSQFSFINGHSSSKKSWVITLMPHSSGGTVTIPPITIGHSQSNALTLTITAAGSAPAPGTSAAAPDPNLFVESTISPRQGRVQQQLIYTVRLFRAVNLAQAQLSEPKVAHAVVVRLGDDRTFETVRGGRRYLVTERKYAIFPQQRGRLTIAPLRFDGQTLSGGSMFDPFNAFGRAVRRFSNPVTVDVAGVPAAWKGGNWLPATAVRLTQTLSKEPYKVGEPITREVVLAADGLTAAQLPPLLDGVLPDGLKRYPDQPQTKDATSPSGVTGTRREKVAVIPLHGGTFILPGVEIPWWNTASNRMEIASIPPRTIHVTGAAAAPSSKPKAPAVSAAPQPEASAAVEQQRPANGRLIWWQGAVAVLLLLWLGTLSLWWRARGESRARPARKPDDPDDDRQAERRVIDGCRRGDAAAVAQALGLWQRQMERQGVDLRRDYPDLARAIDALYQQRYGGGGQCVDLDGFSADFTRVCEALHGAPRSESAPLPPLYPR